MMRINLRFLKAPMTLFYLFYNRFFFFCHCEELKSFPCSCFLIILPLNSQPTFYMLSVLSLSTKASLTISCSLYRDPYCWLGFTVIFLINRWFICTLNIEKHYSRLIFVISGLFLDSIFELKCSCLFYLWKKSSSLP